MKVTLTGSAPLTAVQMLWVNLIMDTLGALALATEPPTDGLMKRPPIGRNVNFITGTMWKNIIGQSIYQILVLLVLKFNGKRLLNLKGPDATITLNTVIFNSFVFCQVPHIFFVLIHLELSFQNLLIVIELIVYRCSMRLTAGIWRR